MSFQKNISLFVSAVVVAGLVFSISHYHSKTMECLNHVESQHITDNDLLCPVCGVTAAELSVTLLPDANFEHQSGIISLSDDMTLLPTSILLSSRAPPELA